MPIVSVVIPTFNRCDALEKAIKSVCDQTFDDFEILVVDDGSTDRTGEFLKTQSISKLRYFRFEENRGGNHARNKGVALALGTFVAFLDDDDQWVPEKLAIQLELVEKKQTDICYTAIKVFTPPKQSARLSFRKPKYDNLHKSIMFDNFIGATSSLLVRKSCIDAIGGFDPDLPALQDYDLFIRLLAKGCSLVSVKDPLVNYYNLDAHRKITFSHARYKEATTYLLNKFKEDPFCTLLRRRFRIIEFKRALRFRRFFFEALQFYTKQIFA